MPVGKLALDILEKVVLKKLGADDRRVLVGPGIGIDAAVIDFGDEVLVVHSDPITAAIEYIGWLSIHVASNDVAVCGARPRWALTVLMLPSTADNTVLEKIVDQIDRAAKELGISIVGGHTEYTPELSRPIVVATVMGTAPRNRFVTAAGARPGDVVVIVKPIAMEGTAIVASDFASLLEEKGVDKNVIARCRKLIERISVVREALALAECGASAMHDPTEGGIASGIAEIAYASRVEIVLYEDKLPILPETKIVCETLGIDPLKLLSSGTLIATIPRNRLDEAVRVLDSLKVEYSIAGEVRHGFGAKIVRRSGDIEIVPHNIVDEIYKLWSLAGARS